MTCRHIRKELVDYILHELIPERELIINQHLAECENCSAKLEAYRTVVAELNSTPLVYPSAQIQKMIWHRLKPVPAPIFKRLFFYPIKLYQTAVALLLLAAGFLIYFKIATPSKETAPTLKFQPVVPRYTVKDSAPYFIPAPSTFDISWK